MKKLFTIISIVILVLALSGCAGLDVIRKYSQESFNSISTNFSKYIKDNTTTDHYYYLSIDNETTLKISHDYDLTGNEDIVIATPLKPFTDAKLDVSKLGEGYRVSGDTLLLTVDYGKGSGMQDNVTNSLFQSVSADRKALTYHQDLDHYGIKLTKGKFEYAKNYTNNDKDIVFVIAAKPLADIGVDVQNISGWIFKTMQDTDGSSIDVLLKPYNLQ